MSKNILDQVEIDEKAMQYILLNHIDKDVLLKKFRKTKKVIDDLGAVIVQKKPIKIRSDND